MQTWPLLALLGFVACGGHSVTTQNRDLLLAPTPQPAPVESLIPADGAVLSDAEIGRILDAKPNIPARPRVALVHLDHRSAHWTLASPDQVVNAIGASVVARLQNSRRVADASYLPPFLFSRTPTMAQLREAGARYQADLILVFATACSLHEDFALFSANEARAYCHSDSALLDVRTGLVPFVSRAGEVVTVEASDAEFSIAETVRRAELRGVEAATAANASALVRLLDSAEVGLPQRDPSSAPPGH